ncbi:MAG TPA: class III extradiol ring-cleavage dioxygenase [Burkholderiaceae bacterium]|nr:class III extradiol ring-cleavage dioxygenase [Burkholderiaceae bacterium]
MASRTLPTYFISHGGGPWPWMKEQLHGAYDHLEAALQEMPRQVGTTPKAVLMISGHWEERDFTVMATEHPPMIYDYSNFPAHTYQVKYAAPGAPQIAERVRALLQGADIAVQVEHERGYDHGTFSPLAVIYPQADVPVLQLSLKHGYDPQDHIAVGRALAPLRDEGVLIVGSGLSYHNLRAFGPQAKGPSTAFDEWLDQTLVKSTPAERIARLVEWSAAPGARQAHPREDHLLPLMVAVGAAGMEPGTRVYHEDDFMGGIAVSSFMFGGG